MLVLTKACWMRKRDMGFVFRFGKSAGQFVLDISHEDCEEDYEKVRGEWAPLANAGTLGVGGGARVGFFDFKGGVGVDVLDEIDVLLR